jgi:hypothetical protein
LKKLLFIVSFFPGFGLFGQSYTPLLDQINEWQFTTCYFGCLTDIYYTDGDTVVNGKNYKILDGYHFISRSFLIREDVNSRRVFMTITQPQFYEDILLYDFSISEGDSIVMLNPISPFPPDGGYFYLDSIRLLPLTDGNLYRHFYFSPTPSNISSSQNATWVEGVGSLSVINAPGGHPDINGAGHLSCSFKNMELRYSNLDSISVCEPVHLNMYDFIIENREVELFAQSEKNRFILTPAEKIKEVTVFDLSGKQIKIFAGNGQERLYLNLTEFKTGIYILKVELNTSKARTFKVNIK